MGAMTRSVLPDVAASWMRPLSEDTRQRHSVTVNRRITSDIQAGNVKEAPDAVEASVREAHDACREYK